MFTPFVGLTPISPLSPLTPLIPFGGSPAPFSAEEYMLGSDGRRLKREKEREKEWQMVETSKKVQGTLSLFRYLQRRGSKEAVKVTEQL